MSPYRKVVADQRRSSASCGWVGQVSTDTAELRDALETPQRGVVLVAMAGAGACNGLALGTDGAATWPATEDALPVAALVPSITAGDLGSPLFCRDHEIEYPLVAGSMANGIASVELVDAMARNGFLGFFGAAGLSPERVATALDDLEARAQRERALRKRYSYGSNLIHSPAEPRLEMEIVELYLARKLRCIEASAFLDLTLPLVRYRVSGIHRDSDGRVQTPNRVVAKVSRIEVASKFFAPPPRAWLDTLVTQGHITAEQAQLALQIPMAQDLTAEADSGGHTDNRPALSLVPTMIDLRHRQQHLFGDRFPLRVGAAGGIATPTSTAAAFAMGADYVVTGSINQACVEAGTSAAVRELLAQAQQADIAMAPAADMFEMGVKVQVLKRGTLFAMRGSKLLDLYRAHPSFAAIPEKERNTVEKTFFATSFDQVWASCVEYFQRRDPSQIERAQKDPKHQMALAFRWYLGQSSNWANRGEPSRKLDYQIWCGPAMPAFNDWVRGSFLEDPSQRRVVTCALNLLHGALWVQRRQQIRSQGIVLPSDWLEPRPLPLEEVEARLESNDKR